jgi:ABC-type transport system involved in multi-copper enzyme maturation permease subunit
LWKEIYLHSIAGAAPGGPTAVVGLVVVVAILLAGIMWLALAVSPESFPAVADFSNGLVKAGTIVLGGLLGLGSIAHTVNSVSKEVERDTLDGLLTLPTYRDTVLEAKWFGGLASLRLIPVALITLWLFGVFTGGLHPLALPALALSVAASVEFLTSLGLWLSVVCKTSLRANMAAVLCMLLVAAGPWIVSNYIDLLAPRLPANRYFGDVVTQAAMFAIAWLRLCVKLRDYSALPEGYFPTLLLGALLYATAAWVFWRAALLRFRKYGGKKRDD